MIKISRHSKEPVYGQIARQIRALIASGELPPGTSLASVRSLASDLGINLNTVARAYRLLQKEQFVSIEGRRGVRVAPPAPAADAATVHRLHSRFKEIVDSLRQAGVQDEEIRRMAFRALQRKEQGDDVQS